MKQKARGIFIATLFFGAWVSFAQSPPSNDDFENRIVLAGSSVTFTGTLQNATLQSGEPIAEGDFSTWPYLYYADEQSASVWWSWTADASEPVTIELLNPSTNELKLGGIDVWTGTDWSSDFTFVAGTSFNIGRRPFLTFSATNGTTYQLRVVGANYGDFTLKITETNIPIIVVQPMSRTVLTNDGVFFGVVAAGNPPSSPTFTYQWRSNGVDMPGETFAILGLDYLTTNQSANYSVAVSNSFGGTISDTAVLNVVKTMSRPQLSASSNFNGQFNFTVLGDPGMLYRVQSSTNLLAWSEQKSFPADFIYYYSAGRTKNGLVYGQNLYSISQTSSPSFFRTTNYFRPSPDAICINHLAEIRFAKEIWSLETKESEIAEPAVIDIAPYMKNGGPSCPLDLNSSIETSYRIGALDENPTCEISTNHVLEQPEY